VIQPDLSQPLCTAIQIALIDLLSSFGITADKVVGHSSGEIAAAYVPTCFQFAKKIRPLLTSADMLLVFLQQNLR
jgi:acyl transferase domain-containing protein